MKVEAAHMGEMVTKESDLQIKAHKFKLKVKNIAHKEHEMEAHEHRLEHQLDVTVAQKHVLKEHQLDSKITA